MSHRLLNAAKVALAALVLAACSTYEPVSHAATGERDGAAAAKRDTAPAATGGTMSGAGGSAAAQSAPPGPSEKEQQRGNTPPGVDRDGHGPAAGAILDPTGAVTKGK